MLVFAINSFNEQRYLNDLRILIARIRYLLKDTAIAFRIVCGIGGCSQSDVICEDNVIMASIKKNLSDHNIYPAVELCEAKNFITDDMRTATWILIHDTVWPHDVYFAKAMGQVEARGKPASFIFAHTLGLYNLGIASLEFILTRAKDWMAVDTLSKDVGIFIETGRAAVVDGVRIEPLRHYTRLTLAHVKYEGKHIDDIPAVDTFSLGCVDEGGRTKHYAYVASLGITKLTHVPGTFEVPIWVPPLIASSDDEWTRMHKTLPEWKRRTHFLPLVHVDSA
jgi:hypothetical protein